MISAIIIDDENSAIETLQLTLQRYCPDVNCIGTANNIANGKSLIASLSPDLIFLDINMPGGTGIDLLESMDDRECDVIFTTAYSNYAIQAIRLAAIDYLLKPIDHEELVKAIQRFKERQSTPNKVDLKELQHILRNHQQAGKIGIPTAEGIEFINTAEILYCESARNYTIIHSESGEKFVASKTLGDLEQLLVSPNFFRVHKSYLINTDHVKKYIKGRGGSVIMNNDAEIEVARNRKSDLIDRMGSI